MTRRLPLAHRFASALAGAVLLATSSLAEDLALPDRMIWTAYDVGSSGYVEASAIAEAFGKQYGTEIRIMPSGTSIGRLLPIKTGRATYGFLGGEQNFAAEGIFEFAAREWGPQDIRAIMGRPSSVGVVVGADTDIMTPADLKGKKVGFVQANPSITNNVSAVLAYGGLTPDDVEVVMFPSYSATFTGFNEGAVDAIGTSPTAAALREAEAGRGVRWMEMPAADTAAWDRVAGVATYYGPISETLGVGMSEDAPVEILGYRYPQLTVYASASEEDVYNLVKAIDESFAVFSESTKVMNRWSVAEAGTSPAGAPFHPGAVRYLKEAGVWTDADEAWNTKRMARLDALMTAWEKALTDAEAQGVKDADWPAFWDDVRSGL